MDADIKQAIQLAAKTKNKLTDEGYVQRVITELGTEMRGGRKVPHAERIKAFRKLADSKKLTTMVPMLPLLLNLKGKPYVLDDYFPFEPVFNCRLPRNLLVISGRQ